MPGFISTSEYDNATLDNWVMSLGGTRGNRIIGASLEYDSTAGSMTVTAILGGVSVYCERASTGIYYVTYEEQFKIEPLVHPVADSNRYQVHIYEKTTSGCELAVFDASAAFVAADAKVSLYVVGR